MGMTNYQSSVKEKPGSGAKSDLQIPTEEYSLDEKNPRQIWFRDGRPLGIREEHLVELVSY